MFGGSSWDFGEEKKSPKSNSQKFSLHIINQDCLGLLLWIKIVLVDYY